MDKAMIKFKGQSTLKPYMPLKPTKHGIKVWVLGDSHNGYFSKLQVYTGAVDSPEKGLGSRVVKELTAHFNGKYHHTSTTSSPRNNSWWIWRRTEYMDVGQPGRTAEDSQRC